MLVFWKARLVLLAVPKTGTTALEEVLGPRADLVFRNPPPIKHTPLYRYRRFLAPYFNSIDADEFETVAVVREPVDWLGSWYRYRSRDEIAGHNNSTAAVSFDEFIFECCKDQPLPYARIGSQARFVSDRDNGPGVTHLFRYEDQPRLLNFLAERLGPLPGLPRRNVSPPAALSLSPQIEARLRKKRAEDFALWDGIAVS